MHKNLPVPALTLFVEELHPVKMIEPTRRNVAIFISNPPGRSRGSRAFHTFPTPNCRVWRRTRCRHRSLVKCRTPRRPCGGILLSAFCSEDLPRSQSEQYNLRPLPEHDARQRPDPLVVFFPASLLSIPEPLPSVVRRRY